MKTSTISLYVILVTLSFLVFPSNIYTQQATAEYISGIIPPDVAENIEVKDGERFVTYKDGILYAVNFWTGIQVFDVTNVESPRELSFLRTSDMVYHVKIDNNRLYAANKIEGVVVYDISDTNHPFEIARIKTPGDAYWVDVVYPYMYVAMGSEGFCVMDISNLKDPRTLSLEIPDFWIWSVLYDKEKLYVCAKQGGILIYNAANPSSLSRYTQYKTGYQAIQMQIEDNLAYVADGPGGLLILDISSPQLPKEVTRFETSGFSRHVFKSGNYAYVSNREMGLLIIKVTDLQNLELDAQYISDSETYASYKEDVYVFLSTDTKTEILRHNNKPELEPIADQVIDENVPYVLQLKASDADGDILYYEAENIPEGAVFNSETGTLTWTPTFEQSGVYPNVVFTVIEKTGSKLSDSETITITVQHVNRMPELPEIASIVISEDSSFSFQVPEGSDPDIEDEGKLNYRVENTPEGIEFDPLTRTFKWKPTFDQSGVYTVDFILEDGANGADREAVKITVLHVNRPPTIESIASQTVDEAGTITIQLSGTELDVEDQNNISYSMINTPEGVDFDPSTAQFSWTPTYDQSGTYENIGAIMKAGTKSDTTYFNITVHHVNRPPVLSEISDKTTEENKKLTFLIEGSDPDVEDSGKLIYSVENLPEGAIFNPDSLKISWLPTFEQSGTYQNITVTVKDPQGLSDQSTIAFTVNHINRSPILTEVPPLTVDENMLLEHQLTGNDPDVEDAGKLIYSAQNLPEGALLDETTGKFTWTPTYDQSGSYQITFSISDGQLTDTKETTITVNHVNRPPVLTTIENQIVNENENLAFTISGNDPDIEDDGKLNYTVENLPLNASFDESSLTFQWTPNYDQSGLYKNILFKISDPQGLTNEQSITITVKHVNRPPKLESVAAITSDEQQPVSFTLTGSDEDKEDSGKLKYQISNIPDGAILNPTTGAFSWTPSYDQSGEYNLKASVSDSAGVTAETEVSITVNNVNRAPVIEPLEAVSNNENTPLTISLKFSDPDKEDAEKLSVTASNLPVGAEINSSTGVIKWTPTFEQSGEYKIDYIITDSFGATAEGSVTLTIVNVNRPPVAPEVSSLETNENEPLVSTLPEASDPDAEDAGQLKYALQNLPEGASFDAASRSLSWTPTFDQSGTYSVQYVVTDIAGLSAQSSVSIKVNHVNRPPIAPEVSNIQGQEGKSINVTLPEANDPDKEDSGKLKYEVQQLPEGANFNGGSRKFEWTPRYNQAGTYTMTYTIKDVAGEMVQSSFTVSVENVNQSPTIASIGSKSVKEGNELSFQVKADDPDEEDKSGLSLSASGLPAGANFNGSTGEFRWIPRDDQQGSYQITFSVKDKNGASSQQKVTITVEDVPPPPGEQSITE
jgi:hypothetical protein